MGNRSQSLIGFYRKHNLIEPIYHSKTTYYDINLLRRYKAVIVPLATYTNNHSWLLSDYAQHLDPTTKALFDKRIFWVTTSTPSSPFYVLMYTDYHIRTMTRTGYLMVKHNQELLPVKVAIDEREFIIECKGIGSPGGGFPTTHSRNQAGCFNKAHVRITGGLSAAEASTEYDFLHQKDNHFQTSGLSSEIKPLGVTSFELLNYNFGLLLRLVPSSLRSSFTQHPLFEKIMSTAPKTSYFCMGQQLACLISSSPPIQHQNLSLNNMVYVSPSQYDLTDWSETSHFFEDYSAFDYIRCLFPIVFYSKLLPKQSSQDFVKGLSSHSKFSFSPPTSLADCVQINMSLLESRGLDYFRYIQKKSHSFENIRANIQCCKDSFPKDFFSSSTRDWVKLTLKPSLEARLKALEFLLLIRQQVPKNVKKQLLKFDYNSKTKHYLDQLYNIYPPLKPISSNQERSSKAPTDNLQESSIGKFMAPKPILNDYFDNLVLIKTHQRIIKKLKKMIIELDQFLQGNTLLTRSQADFLHLKITATSYHNLYLVYPYYFVLMSYCSTQQSFLKGALNQHPSSSEKTRILFLLDHYSNIIKTLETNPESYRPLFLSEDDALVNLLSPLSQ